MSGVRMAFWFLIAGFLVASPAGAETIVLRDGTVLVGAVEGVGEESVTFQLEFPRSERVTIARDRIREVSLFGIMRARLPASDVSGHLDLARWAEKHGLLVQALAEYRPLARDEEFAGRDEAGERVVLLEETLARALFEQGERYFMRDRPASAKRYFEMVLERYPESTPAGMAADRLASITAELAGREATSPEAPADGIARHAIPSRERAAWEGGLARVRRHLAAARRLEGRFDLARGSTQDEQAGRQRARRLQQAWAAVGSLEPGSGTPDAEELEAIRQEVRERLVRACLDLGRLYLLRSSLHQAEEWCTRACDLDPPQAASHELHERIIDAKSAAGWGRSALGRYLGRR